MNIYTAHVKPGHAPVLLRESWSWGAALFGPFWLLAHRAWVPGVLALVLAAALSALSPVAQGIGGWTLFLLGGLLGRDLVRWSLARRGYALAHVVAAGSMEAALARLLDHRADVAGWYGERLR